jgi:chromosome partitioning protein
MSRQIRLAILSNAGGSGKTTLAVHLAFLFSQLKHSVCLIDLDPQGSLSLFTGTPEADEGNTISAIISNPNFSGDWPLIGIWQEKNIQGISLCQGNVQLEQTIRELVLHERGTYLLADLLQDYPLSEEILIFDCPGTIGPLITVAITAATHILIPVQLEPKSTGGASELLRLLYDKFPKLRLNPCPKISGFVPSQYDKDTAIHRNLLEQLKPMLEQLNLQCFEPIRYSKEFKNSSAVGLPLHLYRPGHPACQDFESILKVFIQELSDA